MAAILTCTPPALAKGMGETDLALISKLTGIQGKLHARSGVVKIGLPRKDLHVTVAGVQMSPPMGLTAWAGFEKSGNQAMVMGDMVLTEDQVNPVMSVALDNGLSVTALHNHYLWASPMVWFMHIAGVGEERKLATAVGKVFRAIEHDKGTAPHVNLGPGATTLNPRTIEAILGRKGQMNQGVFKLVWGRHTQMDGIEAGKAMGVNTWAAFVGGDAQAIVEGDFAMRQDELQSVLKTLRAGGIDIVAIHNHMIMEHPRIMYLHYWGVGTTSNLARTLKAALSKTQAR